MMFSRGSFSCSVISRFSSKRFFINIIMNPRGITHTRKSLQRTRKESMNARTGRERRAKTTNPKHGTFKYRAANMKPLKHNESMRHNTHEEESTNDTEGIHEHTNRTRKASKNGKPKARHFQIPSWQYETVEA